MDPISIYNFATAAHDPPVPSLALALKRSFEVLEAAIRLYKVDSLAISFNGGKDATILVHLAYILLTVKGMVKPGDPFPIRCVYFGGEEVFPEISKFIADMQKLYGLNLCVQNGEVKDAIQHCIDEYSTAAFVLGTRRIDPHGAIEHFSPSSGQWPIFMRVNPLLEWSYSDVWEFLVQFKLSYCSIYDLGYTSLGSALNSHPNPLLKREDGTYRPAYSLVNGIFERSGRHGKDKDWRLTPSCSGGRCMGILVVGETQEAWKAAGLLKQETSEMGFNVCRIVVVSAAGDAVAAEIEAMSASLGNVIVAGIASEKTIESVARGLGRDIVDNKEMHLFLERCRKANVAVDGMMARLPQGSELMTLERAEHTAIFPVIRCKNVWMFFGDFEDMMARFETTKQLMNEALTATKTHLITTAE